MAQFVADTIEKIKDHLTACDAGVSRIAGAAGTNVEVELGLKTLRTELEGIATKLDKALIGATPTDAAPTNGTTSSSTTTENDA